MLPNKQIYSHSSVWSMWDQEIQLSSFTVLFYIAASSSAEKSKRITNWPSQMCFLYLSSKLSSVSPTSMLFVIASKLPASCLLLFRGLLNIVYKITNGFSLQFWCEYQYVSVKPIYALLDTSDTICKPSLHVFFISNYFRS